MKVKYSLLIVLFGLFLLPCPTGVFAQGEESYQMQLRVCERVNQHFADDTKMYQRVNQRVLNRFGFLCKANNREQQDVNLDLFTNTLINNLKESNDEAGIRKDMQSSTSQNPLLSIDRQNKISQMLMSTYKHNNDSYDTAKRLMSSMPRSEAAVILKDIELLPYYNNKILRLAEKGKEGKMTFSDMQYGLRYSKMTLGIVNAVLKVFGDED